MNALDAITTIAALHSTERMWLVDDAGSREVDFCTQCRIASPCPTRLVTDGVLA